MKETPNLYPLWHIIDEGSKQVLIAYQRKYFRKGIKPAPEPLDEVPIDYDKFMKEVPSRSR